MPRNKVHALGQDDLNSAIPEAGNSNCSDRPPNGKPTEDNVQGNGNVHRTADSTACDEQGGKKNDADVADVDTESKRTKTPGRKFERNCQPVLTQDNVDGEESSQHAGSVHRGKSLQDDGSLDRGKCHRDSRIPKENLDSSLGEGQIKMVGESLTKDVRSRQQQNTERGSKASKCETCAEGTRQGVEVSQDDKTDEAGSSNPKQSQRTETGLYCQINEQRSEPQEEKVHAPVITDHHVLPNKTSGWAENGDEDRELPNIRPSVKKENSLDTPGPVDGLDKSEQPEVSWLSAATPSPTMRGRESYGDIQMGELGMKRAPPIQQDTSKGRMSTRRQDSHYISYLIASVVFLTDLADFVSDWLFFADVNSMEPGLVYGPPGTTVWAAILVFSVIGTVLFILETIVLIYETREHATYVGSDILSLVVVWLEDVPQMAISLYLVLCREEAISVFQMVKAIIVLIGAVIPVIQVGLKFKRVRGNKLHRYILVAIFIGMLLQGTGAILVFFLSYTAPNDSGIFFQVPTTLIEERVDNTKYFANVSVYVNHAEHFDVGGLKVAQSHQGHGEPVVNWMRLDSINPIMVDGEGDGIPFSLEFELNPAVGSLKLAWWKRSKVEGLRNPRWTPFNCYVINQTEGTVSNVSTPSNCTRDTGFFTKSSQNAYITFGYTPPGTIFKRQIFGDITFNMRVERTDTGSPTCQRVDRYTSSLNSDPDPTIPLRFHYFQAAPHIPPLGQAHFLREKDNNGTDRLRFFRNNGKDLIEIQDVWKTGWLSCKSQGHLAPTMNENLKISCART